MKKLLLNSKSFVIAFVMANLFLFSATTGFAAVKTWAGGAGAAKNWTTGANWSGGTAPLAGDDIVFNTAGTITFSTMPATVAYNSITVSQGTVNLVGGAPAKTYTIGGAAGTDLTISNGATLSLGANINITMANAGTADVSGTLAVGAGSTYNTNGTTVVTTVTGTITNAGTVTSTTAAKLLMNSGSTYTHNEDGGTVPTATWDVASTCNITGITGAIAGGLTQTFGNFIYNCPGQTTTEYFDAAVNIAGNFTITSIGTGSLRVSSNATARTVTVGGNFSQAAGEFRLNNSTGGVTMTVGGNFSLSGAATSIFTLVSGAANSSVTVNGNVSITGGELRMSEDANIGTLNVAGNFTHTAGTITETLTGSGAINFNGTLPQTYTGGGTLSNTINFTVNNAAGVTVASSVTLPAGLTLTNGILSINTGNTLTLTSTNQIGGTFNSTTNIFTKVNTGTGAKGILRVNVPAATARTIPVSNGTVYLPVDITATNANGYNITVFNGVTTDATPNGTPFGAGPKNEIVDVVWNIGQVAGAGTTSLTLGWSGSYEGSKFTLISNPNLIGIAQNSASVWANPLSNSGSIAGNTSTRNGITVVATSSFAVGTIYPAGGVLPIKVNYFNGAKGNGYNTLTWSAESTSSSVTFDIERSADGKNFTAIGSITATQQRTLTPFDFVDNNILSGTAYYRIKIIDINGKVTYTSVIRLATTQNDMKLVGVLPNPVSNTAVLNIVSNKKESVQLWVVSMEGKLVQRSTVQLQSGSSIINLEVANLQAGMYTIKGTFSDGTTSSVKFVKQ